MQVWLGIPLKKISLNQLDNKIIQKIHRLVTSFYYIFNTKFIPTTSLLTQERIAKAFGLKPFYCPVLGNPRLDILCHVAPSLQKNILYAPTHRKYKDYLIDFINCNDKTEKLLASSQYELKIRLHFYNKNFIQNTLQRSQRILLSQGTPEEDMFHANILITDFSSIFFDYLLLDRPLIFYIPDFKKYLEEERQLYVDYHQQMPGPIFYSL